MWPLWASKESSPEERNAPRSGIRAGSVLNYNFLTQITKNFKDILHYCLTILWLLFWGVPNLGHFPWVPNLGPLPQHSAHDPFLSKKLHCQSCLLSWKKVQYVLLLTSALACLELVLVRQSSSFLYLQSVGSSWFHSLSLKWTRPKIQFLDPAICLQVFLPYLSLIFD